MPAQTNCRFAALLNTTDRLRLARGFTVIELLVVIVILGILIAVAAPSFLGQQGKAHDSAAKQDITVAYKNARTAVTSGDSDGSPGTLISALTESEPGFNFVADSSVPTNDTSSVYVALDPVQGMSFRRRSKSGRVCLGVTAPQWKVDCVDGEDDTVGEGAGEGDIDSDAGFLFMASENWGPPSLYSATASMGDVTQVAADFSGWTPQRVVTSQQGAKYLVGSQWDDDAFQTNYRLWRVGNDGGLTAIATNPCGANDAPYVVMRGETPLVQCATPTPRLVNPATGDVVVEIPVAGYGVSGFATICGNHVVWGETTNDMMMTNPKGSLYKATLDGGSRARLDNARPNTRWTGEPACSKDGQRIAFTSAYDGTSLGDGAGAGIFVATLDDSGPAVMWSDINDKSRYDQRTDVTWTRSGKLVYKGSTGGMGGPTDLVRLSVSGAEERFSANGLVGFGVL